MDLRPQAHEIIRTWLFDSLLRSYYDNGAPPWRHIAISGWVVDSEHKKMGKSAGNAESPTELLDRYGADAMRYWAAKARLGTDTTFDVAQVKVGRRLATKLLNATRFVLSFPEPSGRPAEPVDISFLAALNEAVDTATSAFETFEHSRALEITENVFWRFCDDYLELVKERAYGGCDSARSTLRQAISVLLRLSAPFQPFATEEAWSWFNAESVHAATWPSSEPGGDPATFEAAGLVLAGIRRAKSAQQLAMRTPVDRLCITGPADLLTAVGPVAGDLRNAAHAAELEFAPAAGDVTVTIG
jgi:valyl-tRNA synthetase